jgi:hypothetical protein
MDLTSEKTIQCQSKITPPGAAKTKRAYSAPNLFLLSDELAINGGSTSNIRENSNGGGVFSTQS